MVPQLSALFIMEPMSLPNQREPCKVEKSVLVPPDWKSVLVPQIGKVCWYPPFESNKTMRNCKGPKLWKGWGRSIIFHTLATSSAPSYIVEKLPHRDRLLTIGISHHHPLLDCATLVCGAVV